MDQEITLSAFSPSDNSSTSAPPPDISPAVTPIAERQYRPSAPPPSNSSSPGNNSSPRECIRQAIGQRVKQELKDIKPLESLNAVKTRLAGLKVYLGTAGNDTLQINEAEIVTFAKTKNVTIVS